MLEYFWLIHLVRSEVLEQCKFGRFLDPPPGALGGVERARFWHISGSSTWCARKCCNNAVLAEFWLLHLMRSDVLEKMSFGRILALPRGALGSVGSVQFDQISGSFTWCAWGCWKHVVLVDAWLLHLVPSDVLENYSVGRFLAHPPGALGGAIVVKCMTHPPGSFGGVGTVQCWQGSRVSTWCARRCWKSVVFADFWLPHLVRSEVLEKCRVLAPRPGSFGCA